MAISYSKGSNNIKLFILMVIGVLMTVTILGVAIDSVIGSKKFVRSETVDVAADRMESAVYSADAVGEVKVELEYNAEQGYSLEEREGSYYIIYRFNSNDFESELNLQEGVLSGTSVRLEETSEPKSVFCISKKTAIEISGGGCEWQSR